MEKYCTLISMLITLSRWCCFSCGDSASGKSHVYCIGNNPDVVLGMSIQIVIWKKGPKHENQILVGASAFSWAIWLTRNDMVFDKSPMKTYMQVLYRGTHWLRFWSQLRWSEEDRESIITVCRRLEALVMQIFAQHGWRFSNRIGPA